MHDTQTRDSSLLLGGNTTVANHAADVSGKIYPQFDDSPNVHGDAFDVTPDHSVIAATHAVPISTLTTGWAHGSRS
jgi:hypothetical protein